MTGTQAAERNVLIDPTNMGDLTAEEVYQSVLTEAGNSLGLETKFEHNGQRVTFTIPETGDEILYLVSNFSFNTHLAHLIASDKVFCADILAKDGVSAIQHVTLDYPLIEKIIQGGIKFPFVMKPVKGLAGKDVFFINNVQEFLTAYKTTDRGLLGICDYVPFDIEYRVTVLDGKVLMTYGKTKGDNNQNNLCKGAKVVETPSEVYDKIAPIALDATKVLGLRTANVDIIQKPDGTYTILEVNSTVALKRVAQQGELFYHQSVKAYEEMLKLAIYEHGKNK